jgi:hypothetical protein
MLTLLSAGTTDRAHGVGTKLVVHGHCGGEPIMSEKAMSDKGKSEQSEARNAPAGEGAPVQGEGDYRAAQRYREEVSDFLAHNDVEQVAKGAEPKSAMEARELALAEERARNRSKGDESGDVGAMYPGRRLDEDS